METHIYIFFRGCELFGVLCGVWQLLFLCEFLLSSVNVVYLYFLGFLIDVPVARCSVFSCCKFCVFLYIECCQAEMWSVRTFWPRLSNSAALDFRLQRGRLPGLEMSLLPSTVSCVHDCPQMAIGSCKMMSRTLCITHVVVVSHDIVLN